ncbi:hypothetical protein [Streptomyces sp. SBT349]|uniref:hypothetical protein n=1 Tax=Streptomyces sp. SBT349 TaxID=1580539 RepID=UPI00066E8CCA|nr:hypothetical protein [Streptomyces sp. SBT349]
MRVPRQATYQGLVAVPEPCSPPALPVPAAGAPPGDPPRRARRWARWVASAVATALLVTAAAGSALVTGTRGEPRPDPFPVTDSDR